MNSEQKQVLKDGKMGKSNWLVVAGGLVLFLLGFFVMSAVGDQHHGFKGFLAPFLLIFGMLVVIGGFVWHPKSDSEHGE